MYHISIKSKPFQYYVKYLSTLTNVFKPIKVLLLKFTNLTQLAINLFLKGSEINYLNIEDLGAGKVWKIIFMLKGIEFLPQTQIFEY